MGGDFGRLARGGQRIEALDFDDVEGKAPARFAHGAVVGIDHRKMRADGAVGCRVISVVGGVGEHLVDAFLTIDGIGLDDDGVFPPPQFLAPRQQRVIR